MDHHNWKKARWKRRRLRRKKNENCEGKRERETRRGEEID